MPQLSIGNLVLGNKPVIKSTQYGSIFLGKAILTNTATINSVDVNNSIILYLGNSSSYSNVQVEVYLNYITLTNATTVTCTRGGTGTFGYDASGYFVVIEFYPGIIKSIQSGTGSSVINTVNKNKSIIFPRGCYSESSGSENLALMLNYVTITDNTHVSTWNGQERWTVVEFY